MNIFYHVSEICFVNIFTAPVLSGNRKMFSLEVQPIRNFDLRIDRWIYGGMGGGMKLNDLMS